MDPARGEEGRAGAGREHPGREDQPRVSGSPGVGLKYLGTYLVISKRNYKKN